MTPVLMKLKYSSDGLVDGGVECAIYRDGQHETEEVFDLTDWIQRQLMALHNEAENNHQSGEKYLAFHHIWVGGQMPFAAIQATKTGYTAYCVHPEVRNDVDWVVQSADVVKVSTFLADKAMRVSDLNWRPDSSTDEDTTSTI